jgi:hypothetical protein
MPYLGDERPAPSLFSPRSLPGRTPLCQQYSRPLLPLSSRSLALASSRRLFDDRLSPYGFGEEGVGGKRRQSPPTPAFPFSLSFPISPNKNALHFCKAYLRQLNDATAYVLTC